MAVTGVSSGTPGFAGFSGTSPQVGKEAAMVDELRRRDALVHRYVNSRLGTISGSSMGPTFEYTRGPDGRSYATRGYVPLGVQEIPNDPQATIANARSVSRLAETPPILSGRDTQVVLEAKELETRARAELERLDAERKALYAADGKPHRPKAQSLFSIMG